MHVHEGELVLSATDLTNFLACAHLATLELAAAQGELVRPIRDDPSLVLARERGLAHEAAYLAALQQAGRTVERIQAGADPGARWAAQEQTLEAMRRGVEVIHQATLFNGRWLGYADFLLRVEGPSELGGHHYEVADAKLARTVKAAAIIQMCAYAEQLERLQGRPPARIHVVRGDGEVEPHRLKEYAAYYRAVKNRFEAAIASPTQTYPEPVEHCTVCVWSERCERRRRADDHLSLVAGMRRDQAHRLAEAGLNTLEALGTAPADHPVPGLSRRSFARLRDQAALQLQQRMDGRVTYVLLPPGEGERGLAALPEPSVGDLFLNLEGSPFLGERDLTYLFGVAWLEDGEPGHRSLWAHDPSAEKRAFEALIDLIVERWEGDPRLHVYHYTPDDLTTLKRLAAVYGTREAALDQLLRGKLFVDLYQVVRQALRISQESYALRNLEPLFLSPSELAGRTGGSSLLAYERWRDSEAPALLRQIASSNRDGCVSRWRLREWLESLRREAEEQWGGPISRPEPGDPGLSPALEQALTRAEELSARLLEGVPESGMRTEEEQARWLLAQLLGWHRREAKPAWWAYFERLRMTDDELIDDVEAIGGLQHVGVVEQGGGYEIHRYRFDPAQEHKILPGGQVIDPATGRSPGTLYRVDDLRGTVELRRRKDTSAPHPTALIPGGPVGTEALEGALLRLADWVIAHGLDEPGPYRAALDLLRRRPPRVRGIPSGAPLTDGATPPAERARWLAPRLEESYLPVQGPPGSGKTYAGARMIVDLVRAGRRVGICAYSHRAIANLLEATCTWADEAGVTLRAVQRAARSDWIDSPLVTGAEDNQKVDRLSAAGAVDVLAGTPWLFAREGLADTLDTLFVDEAAQLSLANVLAVSGAARNLVLLGDPQQLTQPSLGSHPPGVDVSALGHVIGDAPTIASERGLLLDTTWRLHPEICGFVSEVAYGGQLDSHSSCAMQAVHGEEPLGGSGLRLVVVPHRGNRAFAPEEVREVDAAVRGLLARPWTAADGSVRELTVDDLLVVAPYNAQVAKLLATLPAGARVGTVDRFQGQEGAVVLFSLTTSSAEDVPHALEFLFSLNRLNVAISRARALAVLVCNPALFDVSCRTPEQMRLVNAFCRFMEMARLMDYEAGGSKSE